MQSLIKQDVLLTSSIDGYSVVGRKWITLHR